MGLALKGLTKCEVSAERVNKSLYARKGPKLEQGTSVLQRPSKMWDRRKIKAEAATRGVL